MLSCANTPPHLWQTHSLSRPFLARSMPRSHRRPSDVGTLARRSSATHGRVKVIAGRVQGQAPVPSCMIDRKQINAAKCMQCSRKSVPQWAAAAGCLQCRERARRGLRQECKRWWVASEEDGDGRAEGAVRCSSGCGEAGCWRRWSK